MKKRGVFSLKLFKFCLVFSLIYTASEPFIGNH